MGAGVRVAAALTCMIVGEFGRLLVQSSSFGRERQAQDPVHRVRMREATI